MRALRFFALAATLASLTAPAAAREPSLITGVDVMSATVLQEGQSSFSGLGFRVRLRPETVVKNLEFMPSIEYWRNSTTVSPYNIHASRRDGTLGVDVRYTFHPTGWEPYVGAGYGVHFLSTRVDAPALGINDASDAVVKGGLAALAGVTLGLTDRLDNFIELKYHHISDYRQLKINWGLAIRL